MGRTSQEMSSAATDVQAARGCRVVVMCYKAERTCDYGVNTDFIFGNQPLTEMLGFFDWEKRLAHFFLPFYGCLSWK